MSLDTFKSFIKAPIRPKTANAWDPWSMLGNGNAGDDSLDGVWGRHTALAATGWPPNNPAMEYRAVGNSM